MLKSDSCYRGILWIRAKDHRVWPLEHLQVFKTFTLKNGKNCQCLGRGEETKPPAETSIGTLLVTTKRGISRGKRNSFWQSSEMQVFGKAVKMYASYQEEIMFRRRKICRHLVGMTRTYGGRIGFCKRRWESKWRVRKSKGSSEVSFSKGQSIHLMFWSTSVCGWPTWVGPLLVELDFQKCMSSQFLVVMGPLERQAMALVDWLSA